MIEAGRKPVVELKPVGVRCALLLGNGDYECIGKLPHEANVKAVRGALEKLGFKLIEVELNLSGKKLKKAIKRFGEKLEEIIEKIHKRRHQDVARWIVGEYKETEIDSDRTELISSHFCLSVIGIVYYWLTKPEDHEHTKKLHDNLKNTMTLLLRER